MDARRLVTMRLLPGTLALVVVLSSGCASLKRAGLGYASWDHFRFSLKANWDQFVGWQPVATPEDVAAEARQGGWWGDEVEVWRDAKPAR